MVAQCRRCGVWFEVQRGAAGQFCTVDCYRRRTVMALFSPCVTAIVNGTHEFQPDHNGECLVCDEWADDPRHV